MKLTVTKTEKHRAELYGYDLYPNQYNANRLTSRSKEGIKLFIKGVLEDGTPVSFFTPTTVVSITTGMLNYKMIHTKTGWFDIKKGEQVGHENMFYYEGSTECPVWIESKDEVIQLVNAGDVIDIEFKVKGSIGKEKRLWYVKRINFK